MAALAKTAMKRVVSCILVVEKGGSGVSLFLKSEGVERSMDWKMLMLMLMLMKRETMEKERRCLFLYPLEITTAPYPPTKVMTSADFTITNSSLSTTISATAVLCSSEGEVRFELQSPWSSI